MKEFKLNEYISLKLEENSTVLYINGDRFIHCKSLLLNLSDNLKIFLIDSESIEAAKINLKCIIERESVKIDPQKEFSEHCSNLQAWTTNNYDTRLLHSNLAFPILKKLTEVGDPKARKVFKKTIPYFFDSCYLPIMLYLIELDYLNLLKEDEIGSIIETPPNIIEKILLDFYKHHKQKEWKELYFILNAIREKMPKVFDYKIKKFFQKKDYRQKFSRFILESTSEIDKLGLSVIFLENEEISTLISPPPNIIEKIINNVIKDINFKSTNWKDLSFLLNAIRKKSTEIFDRKLKEIFKKENYKIIYYLFISDSMTKFRKIGLKLISDRKINLIKILINTINYVNNTPKMESIYFEGKVDGFLFYCNLDEDFRVALIEYLDHNLKNENFDVISFVFDSGYLISTNDNLELNKFKNKFMEIKSKYKNFNNNLKKFNE